MGAQVVTSGALRQSLLVLYLDSADLASPVVAWSRYDGTSEVDPVHGAETEPPYASVVAAMRDGWRVIQFPVLFPPNRDDPYGAAHLQFEYVLERISEVKS